jgi:hypothetical protein
VLFSQVTGAVLRGIIAEEIARVEVVVVHKICLEKYSKGKRGRVWSGCWLGCVVKVGTGTSVFGYGCTVKCVV